MTLDSGALKSFFDAAVYGDLDSVKRQLVQNPKLITATDEYGFTALHGVVGEENLEMANTLLENGAHVHAKNDIGMTPLHIAQYAGMVEILIQHGADVNARCKGGGTPLHVQAQEGQDTGSLEVMEALLKAGADPNIQDSNGKTPLNFAEDREEDDKISLLRSFGAKDNS